MQKLNGYKTYIVAALMATVGFAAGMGWITPEQAKQLDLILAPFLAAAFRSAIK